MKTKTGVEPRNPRASTYSRFERPTAERRIRFGTIFMPRRSFARACTVADPGKRAENYFSVTVVSAFSFLSWSSLPSAAAGVMVASISVSLPAV